MCEDEPRVYQKQPLYFYEVGLMFAYTLPSPDAIGGITPHILLLLHV